MKRTSRRSSREDASGGESLRRLLVVKWVVVLGLLAAFAIAPRLWLHERFFGPIPVASWMPRLAPPWDHVWLGALVLLLFPILAARRARLWILLWCALYAARSVWDQITWQPYFYQYFFMLLSLAFVDWSVAPGSEGRRRAVLDANRLILFCVYFWSGFAKLHVRYLESGGVFLPYAFFGELPAAARVVVPLVPAVFELAFALALLTPRFRRAGVIGLVAMHVLILGVYGPLGHGHNPVVWPWNVAMMILLPTLFWEERAASARRIFWNRGFAYHALVVFLFLVCPALSYVGLFPTYLSFRLYAQREYVGRIALTQEVIERLPEAVRAHVIPKSVLGFAGYLAIPYWAESELGAFPPGDPGVYKGITSRFGELAERPSDVALFMDDPPDAWTGYAQQRRFDLDQLD